jgi:O-antigen ligase
MGTILAAAVVMAAFPFIRWPSYALHYLAAYLLFGTALIYFGGVEWIVREVFDAGTLKGASQRGTLLQIGLEKLDRSVLVGTGPQGFGQFSTNFWHRPVHNAYIQAATELGLLGIIVFVAMNVWLFTAMILTRAISTESDRKVLTVFLMVHVILMGIFMTEPAMDHSNTWLILGIMQAAILVIGHKANRPALLPATR